jgi:hypothetical protein
MAKDKPALQEVFPLLEAEPIGQVETIDDVKDLFGELLGKLYESEADFISRNDGDPDGLRRLFLKQVDFIFQALSCVGITETMTMTRVLAEIDGVSHGIDSRLLITENAAIKLKITENKRTAVTAEVKKKIAVATSLILQKLDSSKSKAQFAVGKVVERSRHTIQNWESLYRKDKEVVERVEEALSSAIQDNTSYSDILERFRETVVRLS